MSLGYLLYDIEVVIWYQFGSQMSKGLYYCGGKWADSFCITKLIEASLDCLIVVAIAAQAALDVRMRGRFQFGFTQVIQSLMLLTVICNLGFCVSHNLTWFYYLESLFYDWYFCTLVFYVTYRIVAKTDQPRSTLAQVLKVAYVLIMLCFLAIFMYSGIADIIDCRQIWFLTIDVLELVICVVMIRVGYQNHRLQVQKFLTFTNEEQVYNPLSRMWTLILVNLFCQLTQLTESLVFFFQSSTLKCHFSSSQTTDVVVKFIFSLMSLYLSYFCTLVIFHMRREAEQKCFQLEQSKARSKSLSIDKPDHMIEMLDMSANASALGNSI